MTDPTDELILPDPVDYARRLWDEWVAHPMAMIPTRFKPPGSDPEFDARLDRAMEAAVTSGDTNDYDTSVILAACCLREHMPMPPWLACFAADVLEGKRQRRTKRGPDPYATFMRDWRLSWLTRTVAHHFGLQTYSHNELSRKPTAAEVVSQAADVPKETVINALRRFPPESGGKVSI